MPRRTILAIRELSSESGNEFDEMGMDDSEWNKSLTGSLWRIFKPQTRSSFPGCLYADLITRPNDINVIMDDLMMVFHRSIREGITEVYQYFVDVCGMQNINVKEVYEFDDRALDETIFAPGGMLIKKSLYTYFSTSAELLKLSIRTFVFKLVSTTNNNRLLYTLEFANHICKLFQYIAFESQDNVVRVTGNCLALIFLSALVALENPSRDTQIYEQYLRCFFKWAIINSKCTGTPVKPFQLLFAFEVRNWMVKFDLVNEMQGFGIIRNIFERLTSDEVAVELLGSIQIMMENDNAICINNRVAFANIVMVNVMNCFAHDGKWSREVALRLFTNMAKQIDLSKELLNEQFLVFILSHTYAQAKLAAETTMLHTTYKGLELLLQIAMKFYVEIKMDPHWLVDAFYECEPALQDWKLWSNLLVSETNEQRYIALTAILYEAIQRTIEGPKSALRRKLFIDRHIDNEFHRTIENNIIARFEHVITQWKDNKNIVHNVVKILILIDYQNLQVVLTIWPMFLKALYFIKFDNDFVCDWCKFIKKLSNRRETKAMSNVAILEVKKQLEDVFKNPVLGLHARIIEKTLLMITHLFKQELDLTSIEWELFFNSLNRVPKSFVDIKKHLIECCKLYLIQSFINAFNAKDDSIGVVIQRFNMFINEMLPILQAPRITEFYYSVTVFGHTCELYSELKRFCVKNHMDENEEFAVPFALSQSQLKILIDFYDLHIIRSKVRKSPEDNYLVECATAKLLNLNFCLLNPLNLFYSVYRNYFSHKELFGGVLDKTIIKWFELNTLNVNVAAVILKYYENIHENGVPNSAQMTQLRDLAEHFSSHNIFSVEPNQSMEVVQEGIKIACKDQKYWNILQFFEYFLVNLTLVHRECLVNWINETVPQALPQVLQERFYELLVHYLN